MSLFPYALRLDVYSHGLKVSRFHPELRRHLVEFCRGFGQYGLVPVGRGMYDNRIIKVFAAATKLRDVYYFHRNSLDELLAHLRQCGIGSERIERFDHPMYVPDTVNFEAVNEERTPRDDQIKAMDFFLEEKPRSKVLTLQTGKGKTASCFFTLPKLNTRTVLILKSMYMDQWVNEAKEIFDLKKGELYVINGAKPLKALISLAKHDPDFNPKLIVISNTTYRMFMRSYLDHAPGDTGYECAPSEFFETVKAGLRIIDEVHQDFHLNFLIDCMTHVPKSISLSATLVSDDQFINRMYQITFPTDTHAPKPPHDKYIEVVQIPYRFADETPIKFTNMMRQYSQVIYEKSIMRQPRIWRNYINMIVDIAEHQHFKFAVPGQKIAVFCGTVAMCESVQAALEKKHPEKKVRRFVAEDPDSHLVEADAIVTTLQSCGTAKDIKGLRTCLSTIALSAKQANEQLIGRLRRLKDWPDVTPKFVFITNKTNPKHIRYAADKSTKLDGKVLRFSNLTSDYNAI